MFKNVGQWLEPSRMARAAIGYTLGAAAESLGRKLYLLPQLVHYLDHLMDFSMNNGHRSELHPHTNMHTQMHIKQD